MRIAPNARAQPRPPDRGSPSLPNAPAVVVGCSPLVRLPVSWREDSTRSTSSEGRSSLLDFIGTISRAEALRRREGPDALLDPSYLGVHHRPCPRRSDQATRPAAERLSSPAGAKPRRRPLADRLRGASLVERPVRPPPALMACSSMCSPYLGTQLRARHAASPAARSAPVSRGFDQPHEWSAGSMKCPPRKSSRPPAA